jgi:hypothetical protein
VGNLVEYLLRVYGDTAVDGVMKIEVLKRNGCEVMSLQYFQKDSSSVIIDTCALFDHEGLTMMLGQVDSVKILVCLLLRVDRRGEQIDARAHAESLTGSGYNGANRF